MLRTLERLVAGLMCWLLFLVVIVITILAALLAVVVMLLAGMVRLLQMAITALWPLSKGPRNA